MGFICDRPLLEPILEFERFFDIEPDQVEQVLGALQLWDALAPHLQSDSRETLMRALEMDGAWSADILAG